MVKVSALAEIGTSKARHYRPNFLIKSRLRGKLRCKRLGRQVCHLEIEIGLSLLSGVPGKLTLPRTTGVLFGRCFVSRSVHRQPIVTRLVIGFPGVWGVWRAKHPRRLAARVGRQATRWGSEAFWRTAGAALAKVGQPKPGGPRILCALGSGP